MSVHLSASFYKTTIDKFSLVKSDPLAFPILLSFLEKASQSATLLRGAKDVVSGDEKFKAFYQKTCSNLPPYLAQIIQQQEAEIQERLRPALDAETRNKMRVHDLETELRLRKEYEEKLERKRDKNHLITHEAVLNAVQQQLLTREDIAEIKQKYADAAKHDRIHKYIGYAVGAIGVAVSIVGWPSIWNRIAGQSDPPPPLQIRLALSGLCLPSDVWVEARRDRTSTLPSSGFVCLVVPDDPPAIKDGNKISPPAVPKGISNDLLIGKSWLDRLNNGETIELFKKDGSSICLHMPKPVPCIGAEMPSAIIPRKPNAPPPVKRRMTQRGRRHLAYHFH